MKFLAIGKMRGGCCDHGWGTRGNTNYEVFEADSMEDAKRKVLEYDEEEECSMFGDVVRSEGDWRGESLVVYAIADEFHFDVKALQAQDALELKAWRERKQREADERELARLQEKLGKK